MLVSDLYSVLLAVDLGYIGYIKYTDSRIAAAIRHKQV